MNADTANYKLTSFGLYVPNHIAEHLQHLDMTTVALYGSHLKNAGKAEATVDKYCRLIQHFILFLGDHYLSINYVRAWLNNMKKTYHVNTVNNAVSALNGLFKWMNRPDCIVSFFPYQEPQYREDKRNLEITDFKRLMDVADTRMRAILLTFLGTGIRVSELQYFTVEAVKTGRIIVENKGKTRLVFLDLQTKKTLLGFCKEKGVTSGIIFRNRIGSALSRSYLWRAMKKLARKAKVEVSKVFPHNLRHLFAVERYKADRDIEGLRLDLGHSQVVTTQRYLKETERKHLERVMRRAARPDAWERMATY